MKRWQLVLGEEEEVWLFERCQTCTANQRGAARTFHLSERASLLLAGAVPADSCCHSETAMVPEEHMVLTPYTCLDTGLWLRMQIEICRHAAIGSVLNQEVD